MSAFKQPEWIALRDVKMLTWFGGNHDAVDAVNTVCDICDVWDDLIDQDKPVTPEMVNGAFVNALIGLNANAFYRQHQASFFPLFVVGTNAWLDANELQRAATERGRMLGFFIRTFGFEIAHLTAYLTGGWDHLRAVSMDMREFFEMETYHEWEHRHGLE